MTTINASNEVFTLINVFYVAPKNQQKLVDLLTEATQNTMEHIPGFVSANIHKSLDGKRVVNYAQWESKEHFQQMLSNTEAVPHMKKAAELATDYDPIQIEVIDSIASKK